MDRLGYMRLLLKSAAGRQEGIPDAMLDTRTSDMMQMVASAAQQAAAMDAYQNINQMSGIAGSPLAATAKRGGQYLPSAAAYGRRAGTLFGSLINDIKATTGALAGREWVPHGRLADWTARATAAAASKYGKVSPAMVRLLARSPALRFGLKAVNQTPGIRYAGDALAGVQGWRDADQVVHTWLPTMSPARDVAAGARLIYDTGANARQARESGMDVSRWGLVKEAAKGAVGPEARSNLYRTLWGSAFDDFSGSIPWEQYQTERRASEQSR